MAETDYGMYSWAMSDPEVSRILTQAKNEGWTPDKLQLELSKTTWWRTHQASTRQWDALKQSDPAQAQYLADQKYRELWALADQMGVRVTDEWLKGWTEQALRYGWSPQQQRKIVADAWQYMQYADTGGVEGERNLGGAAAGVIMDINRLAGEYSIPIDEATKQQWTRQVLAGTVDVESFQAYLAQLAAADNPWMKSQLDQGFTVKQILSPFLMTAANELGIPVEQIDLSDPKWRQLVEVTDEKGEKIRPDTRTILKIIRRDERFGFDKTDAALNTATDLNRGLLQMFGAIG